MTAPHSTSLPDSRLMATREWVQSRGTNLITNGTGYMQDNTNFPTATFDKVDSPNGVTGSFSFRPAGSTEWFSEIVPINTANTYRVQYWARQAIPGSTGRHYFVVAPRDAYGNTIGPTHTYFRPESTTVLTRDLAPGDAEAHLESVEGWNTTSGSRHFGVWNYVDPGGKLWEPETYTRNVYTSIYPTDGVNPAANTITLNAPWAGPLIPAGTWLSNTANGGAYIYPTANRVVPEEWTLETGTVRAGTVDTGALASSVNGWPHGTAAARLGLLTNYGLAHGVSHQKFAGFEMSAVQRADEFPNGSMPQSKLADLSGPPNADRPTGPVIGQVYFDTTIMRPIWYAGSGNWVDATGTTV